VEDIIDARGAWMELSVCLDAVSVMEEVPRVKTTIIECTKKHRKISHCGRRSMRRTKRVREEEIICDPRNWKEATKTEIVGGCPARRKAR